MIRSLGSGPTTGGSASALLSASEELLAEFDALFSEFDDLFSETVDLEDVVGLSFHTNFFFTFWQIRLDLPTVTFWFIFLQVAPSFGAATTGLTACRARISARGNASRRLANMPK